MLDSGVPLPVVSKRLGHSSVRTTADIYSHAIHGQDDEATRKWEEYQKQNRSGLRTGKETCSVSSRHGREQLLIDPSQMVNRWAVLASDWRAVPCGIAFRANY